MQDNSYEKPIDWAIPANINTPLATNFIIQFEESGFVLSFFEVVQPIVLGDEEERREQIEAMESVTAKCVSRVFVPAQKLQGFIDAMQGNLDIHKSRFNQEEEA